MEVMMEKAALNRYLEFCISNEDVTNAKPHPEMYTTAIKKLQLDPAECIVVEDNEKGIRAAIASGAHLLRVDVVEDVNLNAIMNRIKEIEEKGND